MATPIPRNFARFDLRTIANLTSGALSGGDPGAFVEGVSIDSRTCSAGELFVALRGERLDGARFAREAGEAGAAAVVVPLDAEAMPGVPVIRVADTLSALGELALHHRRRWSRPLLAIAGSAGKTTTRSSCAAALEAVHPGAVHSVTGNLNNRIGVPMVLLGLSETHAIAVVEIGTSLRGEVRELARIAEPTAGLVTLIGVEHLEGLGSLDEIEAEESDLFRALPPDGAALGNADDDRVARRLSAAPVSTRRSFGTRAASDFRILHRQSSGLGTSRVVIERPCGERRETLSLEAPFIGRPGALAVAAAVAVADWAAGEPVAEARLAAALSARAPAEPGRLVAVRLSDGTAVLDDSYNANPDSMRAALSTAREIADDRDAPLVLVLGEMRELGDQSAALHDAIGREIGGSRPALLVAIAGDAERFAFWARRAGVDAVFATDVDDAIEIVLARVRPGDVVLAKASRSLRLERVVDALIRSRGTTALALERDSDVRVGKPEPAGAISPQKTSRT